MRLSRRIAAVLVFVLTAATFLAAQDTTVYVTKTGEKYHRATWQVLNAISAIALALLWATPIRRG